MQFPEDTWGAFNNYVDRILPFFLHPLPPAWTVFIPSAGTKTDFFDPIPPHLVHVLIECPLSCLATITEKKKTWRQEKNVWGKFHGQNCWDHRKIVDCRKVKDNSCLGHDTILSIFWMNLSLWNEILFEVATLFISVL